MVTTPSTLSAGRKAGVTIGNFDGVHLGHQKLVKRTLEVCRQHDLDCVVVTFWPHPRAVFSGQHMPPLADQETRRQLLGQLGVNYLLELAFDMELAKLSPTEFLQKYLYPLNVGELVIGYDFRLGKGRAGDFEVLKQIGLEDGFGVEQVGPLMLGDAPISSTRLRKAIEEGDMALAREMLGRPHGFSGLVVHGEGRGSGLGFPTANVRVPAVLTPPDGVYATCVTHRGQTFPAVTNIGFKPTFGGRERTIESFILDCDRNLYDETIHMGFLGRLRGEKRFAGPKELATQIAQDIKGAHAYFDGI
ncbi:MAG: bifunctional riboflavin kinase/FAD synthetase [Desulfovibrio sp.]|nr:bifunctional riboflavin kinase/FAD synthetase [Desulfovibrio sp.]MBQ4125463.1 bifunctional riboflavin kinase/FAD synthetase [Desulfovibrio sp.]